MAFAFDEAWIYGGQLSSSRRNVVPEGLGKGKVFAFSSCVACMPEG